MKGDTSVILVANWKMNLGLRDSTRVASEFRDSLTNLKKTQIWIAPSATALSAVSEVVLRSGAISVGAQNIGWAEHGAYTGEISPSMALECGATFAIVGHSERRHLCGESDELVGKRAAFSLQKKLCTIFCVGETVVERTAKLTTTVLKRQLSVLAGLDSALLGDLIIAYEPVWAIGTGQVASTANIAEAVAIIRSELPKLPSLKVIYGGSVNGENLAEILSVKGIAGALVGGASLTLATFEPLVRCVER